MDFVDRTIKLNSSATPTNEKAFPQSGRALFFRSFESLFSKALFFFNVESLLSET